MAPTAPNTGPAPHPRWRRLHPPPPVLQRHFRQARDHFRQLRALFRPWRPAWRSGSWSGWTGPGLPRGSAASRPPPSSVSTTRLSWEPSRASRRWARCGRRGRAAGDAPGAAAGADGGDGGAGDRGGGAHGHAMGAEPRGRGGAAGGQPRGAAVPEPPRGGAAPGRGHGGYRGYRRRRGESAEIAASLTAAVCPQKLPGGSLGFSKAMANKWVRLEKGAAGGPRVLRAVSGPGGDGRGAPGNGEGSGRDARGSPGIGGVPKGDGRGSPRIGSVPKGDGWGSPEAENVMRRGLEVSGIPGGMDGGLWKPGMS